MVQDRVMAIVVSFFCKCYLTKVKEAYSRMEFLRKVAEFTKSIEDKREIESLKQRRKKLCKTARPLQKMYED